MTVFLLVFLARLLQFKSDGSDDSGNFKLRTARVIRQVDLKYCFLHDPFLNEYRQPGDGSCLFHSLAYGLGGSSASVLRREIAAYIQVNQVLTSSVSNVTSLTQYLIPSPYSHLPFFFSSALRVSPSHSFSAMVSFDADIEQRNPDLEIAETPMRDWVKWDSGCSVSQYASRMAVRRLYCMLLMITCIDSNLRGS